MTGRIFASDDVGENRCSGDNRTIARRNVLPLPEHLFWAKTQGPGYSRTTSVISTTAVPASSDAARSTSPRIRQS